MRMIHTPKKEEKGKRKIRENSQRPTNTGIPTATQTTHTQHTHTSSDYWRQFFLLLRRSLFNTEPFFFFFASVCVYRPSARRFGLYPSVGSSVGLEKKNSGALLVLKAALSVSKSSGALLLFLKTALSVLKAALSVFKAALFAMHFWS